MENSVSDLELKQLQKKAKWRLILAGICSFAVFVYVLIFLMWLFGEDTKYSLDQRIFVIIVGAVVATGGFFTFFYALFVKRAYDRFDLSFKNTYVLSTIQSTNLFEELEYRPMDGISYDEIRDGGVVACGKQKYFHSEDRLTGKYKDVQFVCSDVETKYVVYSGKRREVRTIFQGQIMVFSSLDCSKTSFCHLQIFERKFLSNIKGRTAQHKIQMKDKRFNKRFAVFAADPRNAFYILTPRMLEQIIQFADEVGEQVAITFIGSFMYVAIHRTRSMFNGYVDKPITQQRQDILDDAELLRKACDLLMLKLADMSL